jgi:hypothetical protein
MKSKLLASKITARVLVKRRKLKKLPHGILDFFGKKKLLQVTGKASY